MSSRHTVTGPPGGPPAHAARPGPSPTRIAVVLAALAAVATAAWLGGTVLLKSTGPATTTPVSASQITVTPATPGGSVPRP